MNGTAVGHKVACFHCGTVCPPRPLQQEGKAFCCRGCLTVFQLLAQNGLTDFYRLSDQAGVRPTADDSQYRYLDDPSVRERLVDFSDGRTTRVTLHIPSIHCVACVWLLENLFRLRTGIGVSRVNFPRKELSVSFADREVRLSEVVTLLSSLGYEPSFSLADLDRPPTTPAVKRLWLRLGIAGFAFGNIMLVSIPTYTGLGQGSDPGLTRFFGYLSLLLALPVVTFSAADYWRSAMLAIRQRVPAIELPIAAGLIALFLQSATAVLLGWGESYFDSLTGLIFFLLCGRMFQQKTYERLAFDRDYRAFFPLSVLRRHDGREEMVPISRLAVGDRLVVRHGELIPADSRLLSGDGLIDFSFVTGEAEPVRKWVGDHLYAGGRQMGSAIEVETVKPVSQSYLGSLWNHSAFAKARRDTLDTLTNRYSRRFTLTVGVIAVGAAVYWAWVQPAKAVPSFTAVLIVACPCALALAAPFALGTAQRLLTRRDIYLKSSQVIETLARINAVVFDKTGTLTSSGLSAVAFVGEPLTDEEKAWIRAISRHSTHPHSSAIAAWLKTDQPAHEVHDFCERPGCGIRGDVGGHRLLLGSSPWLRSEGHAVPSANSEAGPGVEVVLDGRYRGRFSFANALRPQAESLIGRLANQCELALLSGDNAREGQKFRALFGPNAQVHFNQSPVGKLEFVRDLQKSGRTVMMVGDGLNDAGALQQSDVGVAVVDAVGTFSPASDVIVAGGEVPRLPALVDYSRRVVRIVWLSFLISSLYNVVGIAIAASGWLSPVVCAVLMPVSSITVVGFACGATHWAGRRSGLLSGTTQEDAAATLTLEK